MCLGRSGEYVVMEWGGVMSIGFGEGMSFSGILCEVVGCGLLVCWMCFPGNSWTTTGWGHEGDELGDDAWVFCLSWGCHAGHILATVGCYLLVVGIFSCGAF